MRVSEGASSGRLVPAPAFAGHVGELPAEGLRPRPRLRDTWRPRTPSRRYIGFTHVGGPDGRGEVPDPSAGVRMARGGPGPTCGGPGPRAQVLSISTSGTRGDTGPVPEREAGPGPLVR